MCHNGKRPTDRTAATAAAVAAAQCLIDISPGVVVTAV